MKIKNHKLWMNVKKMNDWPKCKESIQTKLKSLAKQEVFGPIFQRIVHLQGLANQLPNAFTYIKKVTN